MNQETSIYRGRRDRDGTGQVVAVQADGITRPLDPRLDLANKSPSGLEWGYAGSGPGQLALAMCADALGDDETALDIYQAFKWDFVAGLDQEASWFITAEDVRRRCTRLAAGQAGT